MFALVKTGGKQYKVSQNNIIEVEKLEAEIGATIVLKDVVLFNDGNVVHVGKPNVEGIAVAAEVVNQKKGDKVIVFKKKRRHNYRRKNGHRQRITVLKISQIGKGLTEKAAPVKTAKVEAKTSKAKKEISSEAKTSEKKTTKATKNKK